MPKKPPPPPPSRTRAPFTYHGPPTNDAFTENVPRSAIRAEFAKRLGHAMARKGYSQSEVARRGTDIMRQLGHRASARIGRKQLLSRDNVSNWVRGIALPGPVYLDVPAKTLDVEKEWLLPARGVPDVTRGRPRLELRATGSDTMFLSINMNLPIPLAVEVYQKIKEYEKTLETE